MGSEADGHSYDQDIFDDVLTFQCGYKHTGPSHTLKQE